MQVRELLMQIPERVLESLARYQMYIIGIVILCMTWWLDSDWGGGISFHHEPLVVACFGGISWAGSVWSNILRVASRRFGFVYSLRNRYSKYSALLTFSFMVILQYWQLSLLLYSELFSVALMAYLAFAFRGSP